MDNRFHQSKHVFLDFEMIKNIADIIPTYDQDIKRETAIIFNKMYQPIIDIYDDSYRVHATTEKPGAQSDRVAIVFDEEKFKKLISGDRTRAKRIAEFNKSAHDKAVNIVYYQRVHEIIGLFKLDWDKYAKIENIIRPMESVEKFKLMIEHLKLISSGNRESAPLIASESIVD